MQGISTSSPGPFEYNLVKFGFKDTLITETHSFLAEVSIRAEVRSKGILN